MKTIKTEYPKKYRKKPVVIEALKYDGSDDSKRVIIKWLMNSETPAILRGYQSSILKIKTLEGDHIVSKGDFVIKGVKGEFYPCKPEIFNCTYDEIDNEH